MLIPKSYENRFPVGVPRFIVDIIPDGEEEAKCIRVEHPSGLYITDDYIVTHNSEEKTQWRKARDAVLEKLRGDYYKKQVTVETMDGDSVIVSWRGFTHALNTGVPKPEKILAALHILELIRHARRDSVEQNRHGKADPASITRYKSDTTIDGQPYDVEIVVRNHSDGNRYYDHFVLKRPKRKSKSPSLHAESTGETQTPTPLSDELSLTIGELDGLVKAEEAHPFRKGQPREAPPEETLVRRQQRLWQDRMNRFTVIREWLEEKGVTLSEEADVYRAEERMHSRFSNKAQDFRENLVIPLTQKTVKAGFTMKQVTEFLHAQHAKERNDEIAKINPRMPDGGSGMTNKEAGDILAKAPPELRAIANEWRKIADDTLDMLAEAGIVSRENVAHLRKTYQYYVPLKGGPDEVAAKMGTGRGLSVYHRMKRALGHKKRDERIIENILRDHERALLQVEKNRVFQHLLRFALEARNPDLMTIDKPERRQVLTRKTAYEVTREGQVIGTFDNLADAQAFYRQAPDLFNGKIGDFEIRQTNDATVRMMASQFTADNEAIGYVNGHRVRIQINDQLLARAYNKMGIEAMDSVFRAGAALNTFLSRMYTGYAPEFFFKNIFRDFTTGMVNITGEEGIGMAARAAGNYAGCFIELARYARSGKETKWIADYRADGGNTGAAYLSDLERLGGDIMAEYDAAKGVIANLSENNRIGAFSAIKRKLYNHTLKYMEMANQAGENAMRLAIYRSMKEAGKTRAEAASAAKNTTVNFNRKGEYGANANAAWLFFNASLQGTAAVAHANFKGKHKWQARGATAAMSQDTWLPGWCEYIKTPCADGADGKSACQLWLDAGNAGTEADFPSASL
jgi:hypothetical protein